MGVQHFYFQRQQLLFPSALFIVVYRLGSESAGAVDPLFAPAPSWPHSVLVLLLKGIQTEKKKTDLV